VASVFAIMANRAALIKLGYLRMMLSMQYNYMASSTIQIPRVLLAARIDPDKRRQLKIIALTKRKTLEQLVNEAVDRLIEEHGESRAA